MELQKCGKRRTNESPRQPLPMPKVRVWGSVSSQGKAYLEVYHGTMKSKNYKDLLEEIFIPEADIMGDFKILQQDGATIYTAKCVTNMFDKMKIEYLTWPARSPNLFPIENLWSILKNNVYKRNPNNVFELEDSIFEE